MSPHQTATTAKGYLFQLPSLGLPDPAGDFHFILAATGSKDEGAALLQDSKTTTTKPHRIPYMREHAHALIQIEHEGAIWFLPVIWCKSDAKPQLIKTELRRQLISAVPPRERRKLSEGTQQVFISHEAKLLEYASKSTSIVKEMEEDFSYATPRYNVPGLYVDLEDEAFELWNKCRNPTPPQCAPARPAPSVGGHQGLRAAGEWKRKFGFVHEYAQAIMEEMGDECLHKDWLTQVKKDAAAAGVKNPLVSIRPSHELDFDIRGLDYGWVSGNDQEGLRELNAAYMPFPAHAADPEYVRASVNMFRVLVGRRLFTKKEWPPRRTSLIVEKGVEW